MELQRINVKFFVERSDGIQMTDFIQIFHTWIQHSEGEYYDVADYSHVYAGPGILLITHEANISMDEAENRLGLLYNQKQFLQGSNREKVRTVVRSALEYCRRLEGEASVRGKLKFRGNETLFLVNDRLLAPNTEESFHALRPDLEDLARRLYAGADFTLEREMDPTNRFSVQVKTPASFDVTTLLKNLGAEAN
jgi:hypothetical protein